MRTLIIVAFLALCMTIAGTAQAKTFQISSTQIVEHPALDAIVQGFQDEWAELGHEAEYTVHSAQGSMDLAIQIATQIMAEQPDLVLAIATPTAQAAVQKIRSIPVLFTAVTDPVAAGLVDSLENPGGGNVSGMHDKSPVDRQMALLKQIAPDVKTVGVLYNAGEANSVVSFEMIEQECAELGIEVIGATVSNSAEVYPAAKSLVGRVDAIHVPTDNTVASAIESAVKICMENDIPLFSADVDSVRRGAIAALAIDYYRMGRQTAKMAERVLVDSEPIGSLPVETLKDLELHVNREAAGEMGVIVPADVLAGADKIYE